MAPVRWPVSRRRADLDVTRGWHRDGRLRMVPVTPQPTRAATDVFYPLILNSGRIRDQWHTMTRTGAVPRLMQHIAEPVVEVAPQDAVRYQLVAEGLARIWSRHGVMVAKVAISEGQRPGSLFVPMHWNNQFARRGRVNNLLAAVTDPHSAQPESKQAAVAIAAWQPAAQRTVLSRTAAISCGLALAAAGGDRSAALLAGRGGVSPPVAQGLVRAARLAAADSRRRRSVEPAGVASGEADAGLVERCARAGGG